MSDAYVAALKREREAMVQYGHTSRVADIDSELALVDPQPVLEVPVKAEPRKRSRR